MQKLYKAATRISHYATKYSKTRNCTPNTTVKAIITHTFAAVSIKLEEEEAPHVIEGATGAISTILMACLSS